MDTDIIAAAATGMTPAGIGIIRISGTGSPELCDRLFTDVNGRHSLLNRGPGYISYGRIISGDTADIPVDEVMAFFRRGPHSYTGEDMAEIQCHGGLLVMNRILEVMFSEGARPAEPGEFTKRAFLNGRIDLTQAEAVMDVISAENRLALENAEKQISGKLREKITDLREKLLYESAFIEAALDDPENYDLSGEASKLRKVAAEINSSIEKLLARSDEGIMVRNGISTAIIGLPNAGKSSLMNLLAGRDRAIVSDIPGTTRDTLEESIRIGDISLRLTDTAGITDNDHSGREIGEIEQIGVARALSALEEASLVLLVTDVTKPADDELKELYEKTRDKITIVIGNKKDLAPDAVLSPIFDDSAKVMMSIKNGEGLDDLRDAITASVVSSDTWNIDDTVITNLRQKKLLSDAGESLNSLIKTIDDELSEDFYTVDLMDAYRYLGEIIGEDIGDDLVSEIFSRFCMGK